jgi:hypothetical protein
MNKWICYSLICILFGLAIKCTYSQIDYGDQRAIEMLRNFYIAQSTIISFPQDIVKMDSLQMEYCSKKLQEKIKEQFQLTGYDHDLLTNDYGIDSLGAQTLSISKKAKRNNTFIVSYTILDDIVPGVSRKEIKVIFDVTVTMEDGILKVDSIK